MSFGLIAFWVGISIVIGAIAGNKGRSGFAWFVYGLFLWPLALIHVLVVAADSKEIEYRQLAGGAARKCPYCAEMVRPEATVCRHCQRDLPPTDPNKPVVNEAQAEERQLPLILVLGVVAAIVLFLALR